MTPRYRIIEPYYNALVFGGEWGISLDEEEDFLIHGFDNAEDADELVTDQEVAKSTT